MSKVSLISELKEAFQAVVADAADPDFDPTLDVLNDLVDQRALECHIRLMRENPVYREIFKRYSGLNIDLFSPGREEGALEGEDISHLREAAVLVYSITKRVLNLPRVAFYEWQMFKIAKPLLSKELE